MEIHFSHVFGTAWISASCEKFKKLLTLKCLVFFPYFFLTMGIHFSHILVIVWISALSKYLRNLYLWNACFFVYFFRIMGIHFSNDLQIVSTSASSKIFRKLINLNCLCFPIRFPYYENSVFSCFRNCIDFYFTRNRGVRDV